MFKTGVIAALGGLTALAAACSGGGDGREVQISQDDSGCAPASIPVKTGEKLNLVVKNNSGKDYEVEGIEGTALQEVVVPGGRTRNIGYTVPDEAGVYKLKCYVPGDVTTIIEMPAEGSSVAGSPQSRQVAPGAADGGPADDTVRIRLLEFSETPDKTSVKAGRIEFVAENASTSMVHELAVLKVKEDGSFDGIIGEIDHLQPGTTGAIKLDLGPGRYELACLIAAGEAGSLVDHYKAGMHTAFVVEA